ncbi:MAG: MFS transporter [Deltaproteobacteria bacterium]|nr:MFS transporter [Deltaproteobacteria bacterium]
MDKTNPYLLPFFRKKMLVMTLLGFSSGLPLPLTSGTLQAYLAVSGIDIKLLGVFSIVGLPYTFKFLWAPFLDKLSLPILTRRRGWIFLTQFFLFFIVISYIWVDPTYHLWIVGLLTFLLAFVSASQDIVVDAYRADSLNTEERGPGASFFVLGYRLAMLASGALAMIMADNLGWKFTYFVLSFLVIIGIIGTLIGKEEDTVIEMKYGFKDFIIVPLADLYHRHGSYLIFVFIFLYKLGDAYLGAMTVPFLIKSVGFTPTDVGTVNKGAGILFTIIGAFLGAFLMIRINLFRALLYFGLLQMVSNLGFILLSIYGKNYFIFVFCVAFENISGGMGTAAFMAFLMYLCNKKFSATQFAIISSLSSLGRIVVSPTSGFVADSVGWIPFFFISSGLAIPGLISLYKVKRFIREGEA